MPDLAGVTGAPRRTALPHPTLPPPFCAIASSDARLQYRCGSPGSTQAINGLAGCTWSFDYMVELEGTEHDLRQFLRLVLPADYENVSVARTLAA